MSDLDVNEGVIERDEATGLHPFKRCASCEGLYLQLTDGYCSLCLQTKRLEAKLAKPFLRAEYRYKVKLPEHIFGKGPHLFVTLAAATATAALFKSTVEEV